MKKSLKRGFKRRSLPAAPQDEPGVTDLINKLQQKLSAMDNKLDSLMSQFLKRPFEQNYSQKPSHGFNHSHRHDRARHGDGRRERNYTRVICSDCNKECEIPFKPSGDRPVYCKECFSKRKKPGPFNAERNNRPEERDIPRERHSGKPRLEKRQKHGKKRK